MCMNSVTYVTVLKDFLSCFLSSQSRLHSQSRGYSLGCKAALRRASAALQPREYPLHQHHESALREKNE